MIKRSIEVAVLAISLGTLALAQDGRLQVRVTPKQAYVFVDDQPVRDGSGKINLSPGTHEVGVHSYGYKSKDQSVDIISKKTTKLEVTLEPMSDPVSGPFGRIHIEGANRAVVYLNGKTPDYFVGHGDEFNHDWGWKQELLVPPGTHRITMVQKGAELWSGNVTVQANQRVIIDAKKGTQRTVDWPRGKSLSSAARFKAGTASATVAVAPTVIGNFTADPTLLDCGSASRLVWQTSDAVEATLVEKTVPPNGEETVSPTSTTNYTLVAMGPGGKAEKGVTVTVKEDPPPQASASADRSSVRRGERVRLTGSGTCAVCSGAPSYRWTVDQGRIASGENQANAELDTGSLNFSDSVQGRQAKNIVATLEVTCEKTGAKATARQQIAVSYEAPAPPAPKAIQLSDINFGQNSSRVNNCAKRILANELYSQMTDARYRDYDIVLVGHSDGGEKTTVAGKKKSSLDRERVLNTAAFLSRKGDTCKDIELSRIKASWVAAEQGSEFKSNFCDASTREKKSDAVSSADEKAKNRRVEIWLIPKGAELPAGSGSVQELPQDEVVAKGCPK